MPNLSELNRYTLTSNDSALNSKVYINRMLMGSTPIPTPTQNDFGNIVSINFPTTGALHIELPLSAANSFKLEYAVDMNLNTTAQRRRRSVMTESVVGSNKRFQIEVFDGSGAALNAIVSVKLTGYL